MAAPVPIKPGVVFWPLASDEVPEPHPWVVLSGVVEENVLTVNITDQVNYPTSTCVLEIGEHECVIKRSVVYYPLFRTRKAHAMGVALARKTGLHHCADLSPALLTRMVAGMRACPDVRDSVKEKYGFIPPKPKSAHPF